MSTKEEESAPEVSDFDLSQAMMKYGGSFASALGKALQQADRQNLRKIKKNWPELMEEYKKFAIRDKE